MTLRQSCSTGKMPWKVRVNIGKTKVLVAGVGLSEMKDTGKYPYSVSRKCLENNSIFCKHCKHWVHKKCSGVRSKLVEDVNFKCKRCNDDAAPIDNRPFEEFKLDNDTFEVVNRFCYLGDMIDPEVGCKVKVKKGKDILFTGQGGRRHVTSKAKQRTATHFSTSRQKWWSMAYKQKINFWNFICLREGSNRGPSDYESECSITELSRQGSNYC